MSETIYELTGQYAQLQELLLNGELTDEEFEDNLSAVQIAFDNKCDGYGQIIRNIESKAKAIREEEIRLAERRRVYENRIASLKDALLRCLVATGQKKVEGTLFSFTVKENADQLPKDLSEYNIPDKFYTPQPPKLDRVALRTAVKDGKVEGLSLVSSKPSILIK